VTEVLWFLFGWTVFGALITLGVCRWMKALRERADAD
jgi:hypothetical protein